MTQEVIPAGSVFALEVREHHEFEEDEFSRGEPEVKVIPERPFNKMERTSDYVFSLPEEPAPDSAYPWDDRRWQQGDWLHHKGGIGRAEAYFWFIALTHPERITDTRKVFKAPRDLRRIRHVEADSFDAEQARERMTTWFDLLQKRRAPMRWFSYSYLTRFLRVLLPQEQVLDVLFDVIPLEEVRHFFSHLLLPTEDKKEEREALIEGARKHLSKLEYTSDAIAYTAIRLLERVPVEDEAVRLVEAVAADPEASSTLIRDAVNVLSDEATFAKYFDKLDRYELAPEEIPYVFGKGGFEVVEPLMDRVAKAPSSFQMVAIKDALCIHSPRAVKGFVALYNDSAVAPMAHGWLTGEGANAITGLIPLATGRTKLTHVAQRVLREYRDRGHLETIQRLAANESELVQQRVTELLEDGIGIREELPESQWPDWMAERLARKQPSKRLPDYIDAEQLPALVTSDKKHVLPQRVVNGVINRIVGSRPDSVDDLIPMLRDFLSPQSRDAFTWHIFERWRENGCEARQKFCMWSIGFLGTEQSATKLLPHLDEWTSNKHFHRASWALDVFKCLGTDGALTILHRVSQRARSKALRERADEVLGDIAIEREVTRDELEDLVVPDCGLDIKGRREFDFGPRQFVAYLDEDLSPMLQDEDGKVRKSFPTMRQSDDPAMVAAARDEWKLFTRQVREATKVQRVRMERAMISERRWKPETFHKVIVEHPLMGEIARKLLWGEFTRLGELKRTFRLTMEKEFVDVEDEPVELSGASRMGVVHPLFLSEEDRNKWGAVFGEYEISPPFPQLDRAIFTIDEEELDSKTFARFSGATVDALRLRGRLNARGWNIGPSHDGLIFGFTRAFPAHGLSARVDITPGMTHSWKDTQDPQQLDRVIFVEQQDDERGKDLSDVPEHILSEIALDLQEVVDKS